MINRLGGSRLFRFAAKNMTKIQKTIANMRITRMHLLNITRGLALLLVVVPLLLLVSGVHLPRSVFKSDKTAALETKIVTAPAKKPLECPAPLEDSTIFARCPSFWVDFSKKHTGTLDQKQFNILVDEHFNHEAQLYVDSTHNIRIEDGRLVIQALNEPTEGYDYTSGRIDTHGKEDFLYGKLVVRATLPAGVGTWPAIWLLPSDSRYANMGTAADQARGLNDGEIDLAEAIGSYPHLVYGITHIILYHQDGIDHTFFHTVTVPDNDTTFHDYGIEWTPTSITISVDGVAYHTYTKQPDATYKQWPFDQPFYLVINLALGGSWAGRDKSFGPDGIDKSALPATMQIQSINYYPYIDPR